MNITESLDSILGSRDLLGDIFYPEFFEAYPHLRSYFADVNMKRQSVLLTNALTVIRQFYVSSYPAVEQYLRYLGSKHHDLKVPPDSYDLWKQTMLVTLERFHGADWSAELAGEWQRAIEQAAAVMVAGYEHRFEL